MWNQKLMDQPLSIYLHFAPSILIHEGSLSECRWSTKSDKSHETAFVIDRLVAWSAEQWPESIKEEETMRERWRCGSPRPILRLSFLSTFILLRNGARMLLSPLLLCCGDAFGNACLPWWWWWWWWWWCWWWWWWYGS